MDVKEYQKQAQVTNTGDFYPYHVADWKLECSLDEIAELCQHLDLLKKQLFYGKTPSKLPVNDCEHIAQTTKAHIEVLHGIIGVTTEAGELIEALAKSGLLDRHSETQDLDTVNIKEEIGDVLWYCAIICNALGFTLEDAMETNIAKLRTRYPKWFDKYDAEHRNLELERKILEGK